MIAAATIARRMRGMLFISIFTVGRLRATNYMHTRYYDSSACLR
jgi:hypothetical protein